MFYHRSKSGAATTCHIKFHIGRIVDQIDSLNITVAFNHSDTVSPLCQNRKYLIEYLCDLTIWYRAGGIDRHNDFQHLIIYFTRKIISIRLTTIKLRSGFSLTGWNCTNIFFLNKKKLSFGFSFNKKKIKMHYLIYK